MWFPKVETICLLIFFCGAPTLGGFCNSEAKYVIRNLNSSLVLDAKEIIPTMEQFDGFSSQLWTFECASKPGTFYIINSYSKNVLDVDTTTVAVERTNITTSQQGSSLYQEWFLNSDGHIINAELNKVLCTNQLSQGEAPDLHTNYGPQEYEVFAIQEIEEYVKFKKIIPK